MVCACWCSPCCAPKKPIEAAEELIVATDRQQSGGQPTAGFLNLKSTELNAGIDASEQDQPLQTGAARGEGFDEPSPEDKSSPKDKKRYLTTEEREKEVERLKTQVKQFTQDAFSGIAVDVIQLNTYKTCPAVFRINKQLSHIIITVNDVMVGVEADSEAHSYALAEITGILRERHLRNALEDMPATYIDQSILIEFKEPNEKLVLLLKDPDDQQRFFQSISMLRYVSRTPKAPNR